MVDPDATLIAEHEGAQAVAGIVFGQDILEVQMEPEPAWQRSDPPGLHSAQRGVA
jgi:hypothetical protein